MNATPPHDAKNRYLKDKSTDVTDSTLSNYQTTVDIFCDWLTNKAGVEMLNTLTSDEIQRFKEWRLEDVKTITPKTDMTYDAFIGERTDSVEGFRDDPIDIYDEADFSHTVSRTSDDPPDY